MIYWLLKEKTFEFKGQSNNEIKILGLNAAEHLKNEFKFDYETEGAEILKNKNIQVIISSCDVLLTKEDVSAAADYFNKNCLKKMKFSRSFILKNDCDFTCDAALYPKEFLSLTDIKSLCEISGVLRGRLLDKLIANGVYIMDKASVFIDYTVKIEKDVTVYPFNNLYGNTVIKNGAVLFGNNNITNSVISENAEILSSVLNGAVVGGNTKVGPFAYLRPDSVIGKNCKIGDFVEVKKSNVADGTKISHLAYIGDAEVGKNVNIGCGAVFVNYNGKNKFKSKVGDGSFIGCNCNIIAPVSIGEKAFVAAGTTVTKDVNANAFVIGRAQETVKEGGAGKYIN